jgi:hypothetical protein
MRLNLAWPFAAVLLGANVAVAGLSVSIKPGLSSPQPVGTSIPFTATVSGDPDTSPTYEYRFSAEVAGAPVQVRQAYSHSNAWVWTPSAFEGSFSVDVVVKNVHAGTSATTTIPYTLTSRLLPVTSALDRAAAALRAAVSPTNHPLVAFFSAPACQVPNFMRVRFTPMGVPPGGIATPMTTNLVPCRFNTTSQSPDDTSMNFYIAGMYPNTAYQMHWETVDPTGKQLFQGTDYMFTTQAIPASVFLPKFSFSGVSTDPEQPLVLHSIVTIPVNGHVLTSAAADLAGNALWYSLQPPVRTETGGNSWGFVAGNDPYVQGIREEDLAGNSVLQTNTGAINEQLVARGARPITALHHEVRRITTPNGLAPNGYILTIGSTEQVTTSAQGGTAANPVDVIGDEIIVLDQNMNVVWTWDSFNFLDINQKAILNEQCFQPAGAGCEPFSTRFSVANDWLHTNSAQYTAFDGNIVISIRHQDMVLKIAYGKGSGDGHIIWKLGNGPMEGKGGTSLPTFTLFTNHTGGGHDLGYPWFSHQHDAEFELSGTLFNGFRILTLYDDGNTRQAVFDTNANGRCQLLALDETHLVANLNTNADVGTYSFALGSAQLLANGNLACDSGFIGGFPVATTNPETQTIEALQNGTVVYALTAAEDSYRTFRMQDLYTPITP